MLNRVPGPCLTIAHVFRPRRAPTWRPRTPCCQSDEGCVSDAKPASPHCRSGNRLDPNLGATIPLATSAENDPRGSHPAFHLSLHQSSYRTICTIVQIKWSCKHPGPKSRLKTNTLKKKIFNPPPMPTRPRHIPTIIALLLAGFAVSGCG